MLDNLDKKVIACLQQEFPLTAEPYAVLAEQIGISQQELLARLEKYRLEGQLRKMGAVLRHREVGFTANALCAWETPTERLDEVGLLFQGHPAVTHCYSRLPQPPDWCYNLYVMIHGHTRAECELIAAGLTEAAGLNPCIMLYSTREWKKTSMRYFQEEK